MKRGGFDISKTIGMSLFGGLLVGIVFLSANDSYTRHTAMVSFFFEFKIAILLLLAGDSHVYHTQAYLSIATMTFLQGTFIGALLDDAKEDEGRRGRGLID